MDISAVGSGLLITSAVPAEQDQAWYWTAEWQQGEHEADEDARVGRSTVYASDEAFIAYLKQVHDELATQGR